MEAAEDGRSVTDFEVVKRVGDFPNLIVGTVA
jgi:hypothetical protein